MTSVTAREAVSYATGDEWLKLYGLLVGSWVLTFVVTSLLGLLGFLLSLLATAVSLVVVVAGAHKLLVESRKRAGGL